MMFAGQAKISQLTGPTDNCSINPVIINPPPIANPSFKVQGLFHMLLYINKRGCTT